MKDFSFHIAGTREIREGQTTDIYFARTLEILKAKGLHRQPVWAEWTVGELPAGWPWGIFCGLEEVVHLLERIPVHLWALPEGTLFPALDAVGVRVPVMAVEGAYGEFCLYETPLLGLTCQATGVATQAARIRLAAGQAQVLAFGIRRMHPALAPMLDRASYVGGCDGVSSLIGARLVGKEPQGTMPHALVIALGSPEAAWKAFDQRMPASVPRIALVDTYSDEKEETLRAVELLGKRLAGVRLDTPDSRRGCLADLVREIRWELDLRGHRQVEIFVSGGLEEGQVASLRAAGASGFGVGTCISNAPTVNFAMDLVERQGRPCAKRGKLGGAKMPFRCPRCLAWRVVPFSKQSPAPRCSGCRRSMAPMLRRILRRGRRVGRRPQVKSIRLEVLDQLSIINRQTARGTRNG